MERNWERGKSFLLLKKIRNDGISWGKSKKGVRIVGIERGIEGKMKKKIDSKSKRILKVVILEIKKNERKNEEENKKKIERLINFNEIIIKYKIREMENKDKEED